MNRLRRIIIVFLTLVILGINLNSNAKAESINKELNKNELLINGNDAQSIVFLIVGDGFTEEEQDIFNTKAEEIKNYILDTEPFIDYKDYINVYSLNVVSKESGASDNPGKLKNTYFQCSYNYYNIERLLVPQNYKAYDLAESYVPYYDNIIMVVNDQRYGGSGGGISVTSINEESYEILLHEMGHTIANLKDEYWLGGKYADEGVNMTQESDPNKVPWSDLIGINGVGVYQFEEDPSWFRPHERCKMQYLGKEYSFCEVCNRALDKGLNARKWQSALYNAQYDLLHNIDVSLEDKTLYVGGTIDNSVQINTELPSALNKVNELNLETLTEEKVEITIQYIADNPQVATVSKTGKITAKGVGTTIVNVIAQLEDGTEEVIREIPIVVKKAGINISKSTKSIKVGDTFTFKAKVNGFKPSDIMWSSNSRKLIINAKTGKAVAKSTGKVIVTLKAGNIKKNLNISIVK